MDMPIKVSECCLATTEGAIILLSVPFALMLNGVIDESVMTESWMVAGNSPVSILLLLAFATVSCLIGLAATGFVRLLRESTMLDVRDVACADRDNMSERQKAAHAHTTLILRLIDGAAASVALGFCILLVTIFLCDPIFYDDGLMDLMAPLTALFLLIWMLTNGCILVLAEGGKFGNVLAFDLLAQRDERLRKRKWGSRFPRRHIAQKVERLLTR